MRKFLMMALGLALAGPAAALSCSWEWNANGSGWADSSCYYLVYSERSLTAAEAVYAASKGTYAGNDGTWGGTFDRNAAQANLGNTKYSVSDQGTAFTNPYDDTPTFTEIGFQQDQFPKGGQDSGEDGYSGEEGYLYLVIFDNKTLSEAGQFAVAKAGETGQVKIDANGQVVGPGGGAPLEFLTPVWLGGTHRAAPEPTALALLALGIAGVALRRRVR